MTIKELGSLHPCKGETLTFTVLCKTQDCPNHVLAGQGDNIHRLARARRIAEKHDHEFPTHDIHLTGMVLAERSLADRFGDDDLGPLG